MNILLVKFAQTQEDPSSGISCTRFKVLVAKPLGWQRRSSISVPEHLCAD